jgi:CheY-like chemotaxis protein
MSRILVADDDLVQLDLRRKLLEMAGHEVSIAFSPGEALRHLERGWANLLIMDLRFPNVAGEPDSREGLRLIRRLREQGCETPVVVLSGWPEDLYGKPEEKMVSRVMVKPVASKQLLETVSELTIV